MRIEERVGWRITQESSSGIPKMDEATTHVKKFTIRRCILLPKGGKICFTANFCDSSNVGLGMNYYVVSEDLDGKPYSELVLQGKSITINVDIYHTPRRISSCSVKH